MEPMSIIYKTGWISGLSLGFLAGLIIGMVGMLLVARRRHKWWKEYTGRAVKIKVNPENAALYTGGKFREHGRFFDEFDEGESFTDGQSFTVTYEHDQYSDDTGTLIARGGDTGGLD
jgi:hypothetical protein